MPIYRKKSGSQNDEEITSPASDASSELGDKRKDFWDSGHTTRSESPPTPLTERTFSFSSTVSSAAGSFRRRYSHLGSSLRISRLKRTGSKPLNELVEEDPKKSLDSKTPSPESKEMSLIKNKFAEIHSELVNKTSSKRENEDKSVESDEMPVVRLGKQLEEKRKKDFAVIPALAQEERDLNRELEFLEYEKNISIPRLLQITNRSDGDGSKDNSDVMFKMYVWKYVSGEYELKDEYAHRVTINIDPKVDETFLKSFGDKPHIKIEPEDEISIEEKDSKRVLRVRNFSKLEESERINQQRHDEKIRRGYVSHSPTFNGNGLYRLKEDTEPRPDNVKAVTEDHFKHLPLELFSDNVKIGLIQIDSAKLVQRYREMFRELGQEIDRTIGQLRSSGDYSKESIQEKQNEFHSQLDIADQRLSYKERKFNEGLDKKKSALEKDDALSVSEKSIQLSKLENAQRMSDLVSSSSETKRKKRYFFFKPKSAPKQKTSLAITTDLLMDIALIKAKTKLSLTYENKTNDAPIQREGTIATELEKSILNGHSIDTCFALLDKIKRQGLGDKFYLEKIDVATSKKSINGHCLHLTKDDKQAQLGSAFIKIDNDKKGVVTIGYLDKEHLGEFKGLIEGKQYRVMPGSKGKTVIYPLSNNRAHLQKKHI